MAIYPTIKCEIEDEEAALSGGRRTELVVTLGRDGVFVSWFDASGIERASIAVEIYGGPLRVHAWDERATGGGDDPQTIVLVRDPSGFVPPADEGSN